MDDMSIKQNFVLAGSVILLNSPPDTGKDFAADHICEKVGAAHVRFKDRLFDIAIAMTGLSREEYFEIYDNRELKDKPHPKMLGKSPRGLLIWISEEVMKPEFGNNYFGNAAIEAVQKNIHRGVVFSDSGFPEEANVVTDALEDNRNMVVVRFTREGKTFEGDSRNYLKEADLVSGVRFLDTDNDGCIHDFVDDIVEFCYNV